MAETPKTSIRISDDKRKIVKDLGYTCSEVFNIGYEKIIEDDPEKLREKADFHLAQYNICMDKFNNCMDSIKMKNKEKDARIDEQLRSSFNPDFFIGHELEGVKITKEKVDKIKEKK